MIQRDASANAPIAGSVMEDLFRREHGRILSLCSAILRNPHDAEEALQETFLRMSSRPAPDDAEAYLTVVARRVCWEMRRRAHDTVPMEFVNLGAEGPEDAVVARRSLDQTVGKLSAVERRLIFGSYAGYTADEIAGWIGVSANAAAVGLHRARKRARGLARDLSSVGPSWRGLRHLGHAALSLRDRFRALLQRQHELTVVTNLAGLGATLGLAATLGFVMDQTLPDQQEGARALAAATTPGARAQELSGGAERAPIVGPPMGRGVTVATAFRPSTATGVGTIWLPGEPHHADPEDTVFSDIEPSPRYGTDHTIYAAGSDLTCVAPPCDVLFRTTDGGSTWAQLGGGSFNSDQVLLSPKVYDSGRFFAFGPNGLQETTDWGRTFITPLPKLPGFAAVAPGWSPRTVTLDTEALALSLSEADIPLPDAPFPAGTTAAGTPVFAAGQDGPATYQPVQDQALVGGVAAGVVTCHPSCDPPALLPWAVFTNLMVSPRFGADGVLVAEAGQLAVSKDRGRSFRLITSTPGLATSGPGTTTSTVALAAHLGNVRLVGAFVPPRGRMTNLLAYSDDLGATWQRADFPAGAATIDMLAAIDPDHLIATVTVPGNGSGTRFACSSDAGSTWRPC